jgi:HPt (histidine-containing phosphotransfer) domain-containing protein
MEIPNYKVIDKYAQGDESVKQMLIDIVKEEFPEEKEKYYNALNEKDAKKAQESVHKLKHKISVLGLEKGYEFANVYEKSLLEGSFEMQEKFDQILVTISKFVDSL